MHTESQPCATKPDVTLNGERQNMPAPIVVKPGQEWDGKDGQWSSFVLQVSTPAQQFRVDISIGGTETWVVGLRGYASSSLIERNNCSDERGGYFDTHKSSNWESTTATWNNSGIYQLSGLVTEKPGP
ncbi:hypothetical protein B0J12DRAFT_131549 [Macrophomina phaseolina]|uniref:Uncharacterized protein n=1 Tax=Macrophomina phaseolina TaxID=35725 RepID=A0ABQ8G6P7_9PEZI|nr:hypothetical protein B0J12DRAFT_131549 [Macrophomina phaseolina]